MLANKHTQKVPARSWVASERRALQTPDRAEPQHEPVILRRDAEKLSQASQDALTMIHQAPVQNLRKPYWVGPFYNSFRLTFFWRPLLHMKEAKNMCVCFNGCLWCGGITEQPSPSSDHTCTQDTSAVEVRWQPEGRQCGVVNLPLSCKGLARLEVCNSGLFTFCFVADSDSSSTNGHHDKSNGSNSHPETYFFRGLCGCQPYLGALKHMKLFVR